MDRDEGSEKIQKYLTMTKRQIQECSPIIYFDGLLMKEFDQ
jgi:hypothetical protein